MTTNLATTLHLGVRWTPYRPRQGLVYDLELSPAVSLSDPRFFGMTAGGSVGWFLSDGLGLFLRSRVHATKSALDLDELALAATLAAGATYRVGPIEIHGGLSGSSYGLASVEPIVSAAVGVSFSP